MSKAGDTIENPVTGERVVVRVGTEDSGGELLEVDTYVRPGGGVTGEHVHPAIEEAFTVVRGRVGLRLNGRESIAELDRPLRVPAGVAHDWWNAGEEAHVIVEIRPGKRFEQMARNLFGLAQDGKTNSKGMPNLLQAAIFAGEFSDVLYFTKPPLLVQRLLFGALGVIARALGYRGSYLKYSGASEPSSGEGAGPTVHYKSYSGGVRFGVLAHGCLLIRAQRIAPPNDIPAIDLIREVPGRNILGASSVWNSRKSGAEAIFCSNGCVASATRAQYPQQHSPPQ
jgi:quercetin dioxygenase-like cupin family protein